jgi:hypothetical protein
LTNSNGVMATKPTSFMKWLGRQIGHVKGAVQTPVSPPPKVVYRKETVQEAALPDRPQEIMRRTTIDEVVVPPPPPPPTTTTKTKTKTTQRNES